MKHGKGIIITTVIIVVICFVAVPLGVNYAFRQEAPVDIFAARWDAADALNYIATSLAFIGTFFLGLVAWKQNNDLQKIETNTFIANNSCEVFLDSIRLKILIRLRVILILNMKNLLWQRKEYKGVIMVVFKLKCPSNVSLDILRRFASMIW